MGLRRVVSLVSSNDDGITVLIVVDVDGGVGSVEEHHKVHQCI